ncbi:MAG: helix-hairpin-helix domain-containing protein, partial [Acidobacteriota bacterium]
GRPKATQAVIESLTFPNKTHENFRRRKMHLNRTLVQRPAIFRTLVHLFLLFGLAVQVAPAMAAPSTVPGVVNVNTAGAAELAYLPRVGPSLAERIVAFRKENGELQKAEDLILIRGIGEKTFRRLEPFVVVKGKTTLTRKLTTADVEAASAADPQNSESNASKGDGSSQE